MTIVEALNFLLAVAGLVLSAYALGKQNNPSAWRFIGIKSLSNKCGGSPTL